MSIEVVGQDRAVRLNRVEEGKYGFLGGEWEISFIFEDSKVVGLNFK